MMLDFLHPQILEIVHSKTNGEISVKKNWGTVSVYVNNTQQSGPWVEKIWKKGFEQIKWDKANYKNILILGLGAGTIMGVINKFLPKCKIVGVEIDAEIVSLGKKYFSLGQFANLEIKIADASDFVQRKKDCFDLIVVDLYLGNGFPEIFQQEVFLKNLSQTLSKRGTVVFNRLTTKTSNFVLDEFVDILSKYLKIDKTLKVDFNTLIYCSRAEGE